MKKEKLKIWPFVLMAVIYLSLLALGFFGPSPAWSHGLAPIPKDVTGLRNHLEALQVERTVLTNPVLRQERIEEIEKEISLVRVLVELNAGKEKINNKQIQAWIEFLIQVGRAER